MTIPTQQYANLAAAVYGDEREGFEGQWLYPVNQVFELEGTKYKALEYMDRPSGYQGAIYQRVDTGEIVVAHRGTEFGRETKQDGLIADGGMVTRGLNSQVNDAMELTKHALAHAKRAASDYSHRVPEVTTTGHSLGGGLSQIAAHKFGLRGEAFNPYGAASLDYGVPQGGDRFINHVMAGDAVSAASPHYGQVRIYAKREEISSLDAAGYNNHDRLSTDIFHRDPIVAAAIAGIKGRSHNMDNFLNIDGDGREDVSVLNDPRTQALAKQYGPMIDKYRDDVRLLRGGITQSAAAGEKMLELHAEASARVTMAGVQTGKLTLAAGESMVDLHMQGGRKAVELGVYAVGKVVETGEKAGRKAVEISEHVHQKAYEAGEHVGRKMHEAGTNAGKKANEIGDAVGDFLQSRSAAVGAAGTTLLKSDPLAFVKQMIQAHDTGDQKTFRAMTQSAANHEAGQQLRHQAIATVDRQEQQLAAERAAAQQQQQPQYEVTQPSHGGRSR